MVSDDAGIKQLADRTSRMRKFGCPEKRYQDLLFLVFKIFVTAN